MTDSLISVTHRHEEWMRYALRLAQRGRGYVEPNPMVGCLVVKEGEKIGEGFHQRFGGNHAEVEALSELPSGSIEGSTIYVTLEPCAHFGKTPPCVDLLIESKPKLVVIGLEDPFPQVAGRGLQKLREAGIEVIVGVCQSECEQVVAPYLKRLRTGLPWIIAKWAMTLDGRLATASKNSKWVTCEASRRHAHRVRSSMDGIMVGIGTVLADDPLLTARPTIDQDPLAKFPIDKGFSDEPYSYAANRSPIRIIMDRKVQTPIGSQLVHTASAIRTIIACGPCAINERASNDLKQNDLTLKDRIGRLRDQGCEVIQCESDSATGMLNQILKPLAANGMTNLLVDGGPKLIGSLLDDRLVDELHVYIAPKLVGGAPEVVPNRGLGVDRMALATICSHIRWQPIDQDLFFRGHF